MIEAVGLTKRFGSTVAVDGLGFTVAPGRVTGFLGPNGSGKSTTMRLMLQLDRADAGRATFDGRAYRELAHPLREVGALLDAGYVHPGRKAVDHLRFLAALAGVPPARVDAVLAMVGLGDVAGRLVGGFSLGMRQRLGLAAAMLGDPHTLLLDEPANGLDPEGIAWVRSFLRYLADEGRTIFVSSHLLGEMALLADQLVVIGRGHLITECSVDELVARSTHRAVQVRSPQRDQLAGLLRARGASVADADGALRVEGLDAPAIGELAASAGVVLHELAPVQGSLEEAFLEVTHDEVQYAGSTPAGPPSLAAAGPPASTWAPPPPPVDRSAPGAQR